MLELRPNCELCDRDLPPDSADARICSYECTGTGLAHDPAGTRRHTPFVEPIRGILADRR